MNILENKGNVKLHITRVFYLQYSQVIFVSIPKSVVIFAELLHVLSVSPFNYCVDDSFFQSDLSEEQIRVYVQRKT